MQFIDLKNWASGAAPDDTRINRLHIAEALSYRRIVPGRNPLLMGRK